MIDKIKSSSSFKTGIYKRIFVIILSVIVILSTFVGIFATISAEEVGFQPYYFPLKGSVNDKDFYKTSDWSFEGRRFETENKDVFETSSDDFKSPIADVADDAKSVDLKWDIVEGAENYVVSVYNGATLVKKETLKGTQLKVESLKANTRYTVQVVAKNTAEKIVKSSLVREFFTYDESEILTVFKDGTSTNGTGNFNGTEKYPTNGDKEKLYFHKPSDSWTTVFPVTSDSGVTMPEKVEAIAFRFEQENLDSDDSWLNMNLRMHWAYQSQGSGTVESQKSNSGMAYFIDDASGEIFSYSRDDYNLWRDDNIKSYKFKSGWVIAPMSLYKDGEELLSGKSGVYFWLDQDVLRKITYNSGDNSYDIKDNVAFGNRKLYYSNFSTISDLNAFITGHSGELQKEYKAEKITVYGHDDVDTDKKTMSSKYGTKYTYVTTGNDTGITYSLRDTGSECYGMSLKFTAPEAGEYDITNYIKVKDNNQKGDIKYRLIKDTGEDSFEQIWPKDNTWYTMKAETGKLNPVSDIDFVSVKLKKGETIRFEAYADVTAESGGEVKIQLIGPYLTVVTPIKTSKGMVYTYKASNYAERFRYDDQRTTCTNLSGADNRWTFSAMDVEGGTYDKIPYTEFIGGWGFLTLINSGGNISGYYADGDSIITQSNYKKGNRLDFKSTQNGIAVITTLNEPTSGSSVGRLRIMKNGEQIFPKTGWYEGSSKISVKCDIAVDDTITIQQYCDNGSTMLGSPMVQIYPSTALNLPGSDYYAALWERPFKGENYKGEWDQSQNIWSFDVYKAGVKNGNTVDVDSGNTIITNSDLASEGFYKFTDSALLFESKTSNVGASLGFKAPESGYYDLSTIIGITEGAGKIAWRISKNNTVIYPNSDWEELSSGSAKIGREFYIEGGSTIRIETYAKEISGEKLVISLGSPTVVPMSDYSTTPYGQAWNYNACKYIDFESNYSGKVTFDGQIYRYEVLDGQNIMPLDEVSYSDKTIINSATNTGYKLNNGSLSVLLNNEAYIARISYKAMRAGNASIRGNLSSDNDFTLTVSKGGSTIYNQTAKVHELELPQELVIDDEVVFTFKGTETVNITQPLVVSIDTAYTNQNEADSKIFTASLASPYDDDSYKGEWKYYDRIWNFKQFETDDGSVSKTNHLNYYDNGHLYDKDNKIGYYFTDKKLFGDLKVSGEDKIGLSLEFVTPYDGNFDLTYGLTLDETDGVKADLSVRLVENGKTIWPENKDWYVVENVEAGENIDIPVRFLEIAKDKTIAFQIYASKITSQTAKDTVKVCFGAPTIKQHSPLIVSSSDVDAEVYRPTDSIPYAGSYYVGKYYPMNNIWNFDFFELDNNDLNKFKADRFEQGKIINTSDNMQYSFEDAAVKVPTYTNVDSQRTVGSEMTFIAPCEGEYIINGAPKLSAKLAEGQKAYFRVIVNDETVYPSTEGWESFEGEKTVSDIKDLELNLKKYDRVYFQFYSTSNSSSQVTFSFRTVLVKIGYLRENKSSYSFKSDLPSNYQLSPYWSADYTMDINNPNWTQFDKFGAWNYYMTEQHYLGINMEYCTVWMTNSDLGDNVTPGVSFTHYVPLSGYIRIRKNTIHLTGHSETTSLPVKVRVTQNGNKVWPEEGDWAVLSKEEYSKDIDDLELKVQVDDVIRFEFTPTEPLPRNSKDINAILNPTFSYSKYKKVYSEDDDIFGMLDETTYKYFKSLTGKTFDNNLKDSSIFSKNYLDKLEWIASRWNQRVLDALTNREEISESTSEWIEGTETVVIPGKDETVLKRRKKTIKYITEGLAVWQIVLIVVGAVVVVVGITVTVIIFVKKKKLRKVQVK